ncbi:cytochrome c maturation protein CcmE [Kushneria indalinina]|uniref:Cytochrome c-type biogenesis protein CcmE n=1 Tax=Kushneria indalinina DSM 14324 TaxID=1122140 RepID=A0A3D9DVI4_9GAMM|nr:cytochrome c maturation protein CcmE [Kushneria indalinina]REC94790.1 cytochrome c-type biogenesis protein CcmE [Kushneria indalinina DSM 14324]
MKAHRRQRLIIILVLVALAGVAIGLTLYSLRANMNLFYSPTQISAGEAPPGRSLRAGGVVRDDSVQRDQQTLDVTFTVTDFEEDVPVHYRGILPDLFREGQGVVIVGTLNERGWLEASEVLAKHDENYMPPEVDGALKAAEARKSIPSSGAVTGGNDERI